MKLKYQSSLIIIIMIIIMFILGARINQNSKITVTDLSQQNDHKLKILSKILNKKVKELGQLSCTISQNEVSVNGGWCSKISGANSSQHLTDDNLVSYLNKFFKGSNS